MSGLKDGGPAFPYVQMSEATGQPINGCFNGGMTLRDWFAGQALVGILANERMCENATDEAERTRTDIAKAYAIVAHSMADAMLAEREKGGGK